jgi:hypothetical protein
MQPVKFVQRSIKLEVLIDPASIESIREVESGRGVAKLYTDIICKSGTVYQVLESPNIVRELWLSGMKVNMPEAVEQD